MSRLEDVLSVGFFFYSSSSLFRGTDSDLLTWDEHWQNENGAVGLGRGGPKKEVVEEQHMGGWSGGLAGRQNSGIEMGNRVKEVEDKEGGLILDSKR